MKYMLDTNICIFLKKNRTDVVNMYKQNDPLGIAVSSIALSELLFGVYNSANFTHNSENLLRFLLGIEVIAYGGNAAAENGKIRADLRRKGNLIGEMDMLIAAHAKAENLILVTNNTREFERVKELTIEDWVRV